MLNTFAPVLFPAHLSKEQSAVYLGISLATFNRLLIARKITYSKAGKQVRIEKASLDAYILTTQTKKHEQ